MTWKTNSRRVKTAISRTNRPLTSTTSDGSTVVPCSSWNSKGALGVLVILNVVVFTWNLNQYHGNSILMNLGIFPKTIQGLSVDGRSSEYDSTSNIFPVRVAWTSGAGASDAKKRGNVESGAQKRPVDGSRSVETKVGDSPGAFNNERRSSFPALCTARPHNSLPTTLADSPTVSSSDSGRRLTASDQMLHNAAIVVVAHGRIAYLRSCLESLFALAEIQSFRLIVSIDSQPDYDRMSHAAHKAAKAANISVETWFFEHFDANSLELNEQLRSYYTSNTGRIANHYYAVFEKIFTKMGITHAIFLEEDLVVSPDFLALFRSTAWVLDQDPTIWCVSAWNDFGFRNIVSDQCRLTRTTYFPGLGFLLRRDAWLKMRGSWPGVVSMGWDYWFRVAFRSLGKECVVPEVSRSRHISTIGSSVTKSLVQMFEKMAFADMANRCTKDLEGQCNQFGDTSYLLQDKYDEYLRKLITEIPDASSGDNVEIFLYTRELFNGIKNLFGLSIASRMITDVRSEYHGILMGRRPITGGLVVLVDRRTSKPFLPPSEALRPHQELVVKTASKHINCLDTCSSFGLRCQDDQLYFINNCPALQANFPCRGCAHEVGSDLPNFVDGEASVNLGICLVTYISSLSCQGRHPHTRRLCACVPH